jgi:hypothetical protein
MRQESDVRDQYNPTINRDPLSFWTTYHEQTTIDEGVGRTNEKITHCFHLQIRCTATEMG